MFPMRVEGTTERWVLWIGEQTHAEAMGPSHLQDWSPRDSGRQLAPSIRDSRDRGPRSMRKRLSMRDRCRPPSLGRGRAPGRRNPPPAPADTADRRPKKHPSAGRSLERWIREGFGLGWSAKTGQSSHRHRGADGNQRPTQGRSDSMSAGAERFIACATRPARGRFEYGSRPLTPDARAPGSSTRTEDDPW